MDADISWQQLTNVGLSVGMSGDRSRYTNVGVWQGNRLYLDRSHSDQPGQSPDISFGPYQHAETPYGPATSIHLRIFVDRTSVEVFTTDGKQVLSSLAYFEPGDSGISLYADGGSAQFSNMTIKEFENVTTAAARAAPYADFDGPIYGPWSATGTAFGSGPAAGTLSDQQAVSGYQGTGLVNSYVSGDGTTGTLSSPGFTITKPFMNFLVGGGRHPRPSDLFADFEGSGWGSGWGATGSFAGQGPTAGSQPNQVGAKILDTFVNGGDASTGTITSPQFTITRDYIDFLLGGGNHPWTAAGATAVNLLVDGTLRRTATGADSGTLTPVSWDVHDLVGHTAQLQVVDNATGAWGHLLVDQILFADTSGASYGDPDRQTTVNLVVGGQVVRTATGQDSEHLTWASWNVAGLIGQTASIRIVDNNTTGWGHVLADAISFDDRPAV